MELQKVDVSGVTVSIPAYYQKVKPMPNDPPNSVPYMTHTEYTMCFMLIFPIQKSESFPHSQEQLIEGTRHYYSGH